MTGARAFAVAGWPVHTQAADARDVAACYLLFLGRPVESSAALRAKLGRPRDGLLADFLHSEEFATAVAEPLLAGRPVAGDRFAGAPARDLRRWAERRLLVDPCCAAAAGRAAVWTGLWRAVLSDPSVAAIVDAGLGPGEARMLHDALLLRAGGLSLSSTPPRPAGLPPERLPSISVVLIDPPGDDLIAASALVDRELAVRAELVLVQTGEPHAGRLAWVEALQDAGRAVLHAHASQPGAALTAALDVARGDYLALGLARTGPADLVASARALVVHDRPEALQAGDGLLIRADACARALRALGPDGTDASDLINSVSAMGGRVETIPSPSALQDGSPTP